jgi:hypothetical protein
VLARWGVVISGSLSDPSFSSSSIFVVCAPQFCVKVGWEGGYRELRKDEAVG